MKTLIHNIGQLVIVPPGPLCGDALGHVPIISSAALAIEGDEITWFGPSSQTPPGSFDVKFDALGGMVTPGLIDCHTHVVFAGDRADEFVQRIGGASYEQIAKAGGGIRRSMRMIREASLDDLVRQSRPRLERMLSLGITTVEAKSGYGLSAEHELKTLRAIARLGRELPLEIVPTFLGAHSVPPEFDGRADAYIDAITDAKLLGTIRDEPLALFADVFCERGAFTVDQARRFLLACKQFGLIPKVHADQLSDSGGTKLAVEVGAASADHLEFISDETIAAMKNSATIPVLLPGCSFFLGSKPVDARKLIAAGLPVALATDCNPGSCMIESLPLIMSIACTMLRMTPTECLVACTANAAAALQQADRIGAIAVGHQADLLILDLPGIDHWPYHVGVNPVRTIIKRGQVVSSVGPVS